MGNINIVLFTPDDINILKNGPAERRRFLDMMIGQIRPNYVYNLNMYLKVLEQRNNYLKQLKNEDTNTELLDIWDEKLAQYANKICLYRLEFINKITHPKNEVEKTYTVTVKGIIKQEDVQKLENGVEIEDYISGKAKVKILKTDEEKNFSRVQITIHEGKNREVRKMCEAIGKKVLALHRRKIANLDVKNLKIGQWRYLTDSEVSNLLK